MEILEQFASAYYGHVAFAIFFVTYTGVLVIANIEKKRNKKVSPEDYFVSFLLVGVLSSIWAIVVPLISLVLVVLSYIKFINIVSSFYIDRIKKDY